VTGRYLVFGDHHGDTESLERLLNDTAGERFDYAVHVGDFTDAARRGSAVAVEQLRAVEPYLEAVADRARHGLLWVYGNRDEFGAFDADLDVGTELPADGCVTVGGQRFTNSLAAVEGDVVLVTHMERWRLLDHFDGRVHFCGNTHLGRVTERRLNSAFLQHTVRETDEQLFGGYFVVDVTEDGLSNVEMREVGELNRFECDVHGERGVQYHASWDDCTYCAEPANLMREMAASAYYGLTTASEEQSDVEHPAVTDARLVDAAVDLWDEPPAGFRDEFESYLDEVDTDRYAPVERTEEDRLVLSEQTYAY